MCPYDTRPNLGDKLLGYILWGHIVVSHHAAATESHSALAYCCRMMGHKYVPPQHVPPTGRSPQVIPRNNPVITG